MLPDNRFSPIPIVLITGPIRVELHAPVNRASLQSFPPGVDEYIYGRFLSVRLLDNGAALQPRTTFSKPISCTEMQVPF